VELLEDMLSVELVKGMLSMGLAKVGDGWLWHSGMIGSMPKVELVCLVCLR
jgi:hypothetical protein